MLGFVIGTACAACLIGMAVTRRHRRWHAEHGHYEGGHGHHHHRGPWRGRHGRGFGPGRMVGWVLRDLRLTNEQRRELDASFEAWRDRAAEIRKSLRQKRREAAELLRGEAYDETKATAIEQDLEAMARSLGGETTTFAAKAHAILDPSQRARLADLLEFGPRHSHC